MNRLSRTELRLYNILLGKAGEVAIYTDFKPVVSVKKGTSNLRAFMCRLRRVRGIDIETIHGIGYRLRQKEMPKIISEVEAHGYAVKVWADIAKALGTSIGMLLSNHLPPPLRDQFTQILVENIVRHGSAIQMRTR